MSAMTVARRPRPHVDCLVGGGVYLGGLVNGFLGVMGHREAKQSGGAARRLAKAQQRRVSVDDDEAWRAAVLSDPRAATTAGAGAQARRDRVGEAARRVPALLQGRRGAAPQSHRPLGIGRVMARRRPAPAQRKLRDHDSNHEQDECWPDFR